MTNWAAVIFILVVAFNLTLGAPFCVGCWWVFMRYRGEIFFRKRRRRLVMGLMAALSALLIFHPLLTTAAVSDLITISADKPTLLVFVQVTWAFLVNIMLYMAVLRGWLLHFEKQWNDALKQEIWRYHLDPNSGDWYVRKQATYGRVQWITKRSLIPFILLLCGISAAAAVAQPPNLIPFIVMQTILMAGVCVFFIWAARQLGDFRDFFFVRNEMQAFAGGLICLMIVFIFSQGYRQNNTSPSDQTIGYTLQILLSAPILCWMIFTMTFQVVSRNSEKSGMTSPLEKRLQEEINLKEDQVAILQVTDNWRDYIQENANFKYFIQFLIRAFSVENLLFVAEVCQFKDALSIELKQQIVPGWHHRDWPSDVPNSYNQLAPNTNWKNQATILYQKYIRRDKAPFEINISHPCRADLESYFEPFISETPEGPTVSRTSIPSDDHTSNIVREFDPHDTKRTDRLENVQMIFDRSLKECDDLLRDMFGKYRLLFTPKAVSG